MNALKGCGVAGLILGVASLTASTLMQWEIISGGTPYPSGIAPLLIIVSLIALRLDRVTQ